MKLNVHSTGSMVIGGSCFYQNFSSPREKKNINNFRKIKKHATESTTEHANCDELDITLKNQKHNYNGLKSILKSKSTGSKRRKLL